MTFANRLLVGAALVVVVLQAGAQSKPQAPMSEQDRAEYREKLLKILPPEPSFTEWIKRTNALPPDFNSLPRNNAMLDPLTSLAMIAPRPVLVVQPLDRDAVPEDVAGAIRQARQVYALYEAQDKIAIQEPWDSNRLPNSVQNDAINWMKSNLR